MNRETVFELKKLYENLALLDAKIKAMLTPPMYSETPLQKVTFYQLTHTYSGPTDYEPKHACKAICASIIHDMQIERGLIVTRIHALGFETEPEPLAQGRLQ